MPNSINGERLMAVLPLIFDRMPSIACEMSPSIQQVLAKYEWKFANFSDNTWSDLALGLAQVTRKLFIDAKRDASGKVYKGSLGRTTLKSGKSEGKYTEVFVEYLTLKRMHMRLIQEYPNGFWPSSLDAVIAPVLKIDGLYGFEHGGIKIGDWEN